MKRTIDPKRLDRVMSWSLKPGMHYENLDDNACLMEAVSYLAGETWNDRPRCVCPVITRFVDYWEPGIRDEDRDRLLKPLMVPLIDTKSTARIEERRAFMVLDWMIRVHTPRFLELVPSLASHARALRDAAEITDISGATAVGELVRSADEATAAVENAIIVSEETSRAWTAAWECGSDAWRFSGGDAAGDVAKEILELAATAAAWDDAARAMKGAATAYAWFPAVAAALAAPKDPSGDPAAFAAWDASVAALAPIVDSLLPSALDLVHRMIELRD